ncbi:unnamed protein product [Dicrocoelium dendriticum]|nr:unnamed protein product [Dicrocoelium dendriticum]
MQYNESFLKQFLDALATAEDNQRSLSAASGKVDRGLDATAQAFPSSYSPSRVFSPLSSRYNFTYISPVFNPPILGPPPPCFNSRLSFSFNSHVNAERHSCTVNRPMSKQAVKPSSSASVWSLRSSFRLACVNGPTLLQISQQAALTRTLETNRSISAAYRRPACKTRALYSLCDPLQVKLAALSHCAYPVTMQLRAPVKLVLVLP